jgi:hypothetical protein
MIWPSVMIWPSLGQATIGAGIGSSLVAFTQGLRRHENLKLDVIIAKTLAGSALPTGLYLVVCAFDPDRVKTLADIGLYLLAAGVALLYVSIVPFFGS